MRRRECDLILPNIQCAVSTRGSDLRDMVTAADQRAFVTADIVKVQKLTPGGGDPAKKVEMTPDWMKASKMMMRIESQGHYDSRRGQDQ